MTIHTVSETFNQNSTRSGDSRSSSSRFSSSPQPLDEKQILQLLDVAVNVKTSDPSAALGVVNFALAQGKDLFVTLSKLDRSQLSDDGLRVIALYEEAGRLQAELVIRVKREAVEDFGSLADYLQSVSVQDRSDAMSEFLTLFFEIMKISSATTTTLSAQAFMQQIQSLRSAAEKIKKEGDAAFQAGLTRGIGGMAAGLAAFACSAQSTRLHARANQCATQARTHQGIANAFRARNQAGAEFHQGSADRFNQQCTSLQESSATWNNRGRASEQGLSGLGTVVSANDDHLANRHRSEQALDQASATAAEQNNQKNERYAAQMAECASMVIKTLGEILMADAEQYKTVAHV